MTASRIARMRAAIRDTSLGPRLALALWAVFAFCVWNVIFDRILVLAGRRYVYAAAVAAASTPPTYVRIDDWMRPAVSRGFWLASEAGVAVLAVGAAGVMIAARRRATSSESLQRS